MTTFGQRMKELRIEKRMTQEQLGKIIGVTKASISGYENGTREPDQASTKRLAKLFDVSTDYILGVSEKKHYYDLSEKEKIDLGKLADKLLEGSTNDAESDFYGEPSTPEQKANLRAAIMTALELNKQQAKKKFTPKKYRDNNNENNK